MDLFHPIVPEERWHKHFRHTLAQHNDSCRILLEQWSEGFPDRDRKFVQEFQLTFNSPFWELYLYTLFCDYNFSFDWTNASPDFSIERNGKKICVEAVTANSADGKPNEWDAEYSSENIQRLKLNLNKLNQEAMIRLSNAIFSKVKKYKNSYSKLQHVKGIPFVLAVAPFEQPFFNYQYNRPIMSVLYDHYVDEEEYNANPLAFPNGPQSKRLGFVKKDNGADIDLGLFTDDRMREVSAVIFSCTATWGKVVALAPERQRCQSFIQTMWGSEPDGRPDFRFGTSSETGESLTDGVQIYHNPYALNPLDPNLFRRKGVVQVFLDEATGCWVEEEITRCLHSRLVSSMISDEGYKNEFANKTAKPSIKRENNLS
jgi:hypothetical protein